MKQKRTEDPKLLKSLKTKTCICCGGSPCDPAHIRSVGSGGPDTDWNVVPMCRSCHSVQHRTGWYRFIARHPKVKRELVARGWEVTGFKLWHPNLVKPLLSPEFLEKEG